MKPIYPLLAAMLSISLSGCQMYHSYQNYQTESKLNEMSKEYMQKLRWEDYEGACNLFMANDVREECLKRLADRDLKITEYRFKASEFIPEEGKATVRVEVNYYRQPSATVKTIEDLQSWEYRDVNGRKVWQILTPPPEFR